jgi:hypothetical protein
MHLTTLASFFYNALESGYVVPVAGCAMILGICVAGIWSGVRSQELRSRERLECIARGMVPPPTIEEVALQQQGKGTPTGSLARRRANIRLAGVVLLASAVGLILFFVVLAAVVRVREVLSGAAVGLIPLAIGIGFLIDTKIQSKEIDDAQDITGLEPLK